MSDQRLRRAQREGDDERRWVEEERAGVYRRWAVEKRDKVCVPILIASLDYATEDLIHHLIWEEAWWAEEMEEAQVSFNTGGEPLWPDGWWV